MRTTEQARQTPVVSLGQDGSISIPREVLDAAGLEPGDRFEVEDGRDGILLVPCLTEDEIVAFWGPNWRAELDESLSNVAAGRTTVRGSTEELLAFLESMLYADRRGR